MSSSKIYLEAIAEAKQLRDIAEQNAKNKIIEAVTPKIRRLIEAELAEEDIAGDEDDMDMDPEELEGLPEELPDMQDMQPAEPMPQSMLDAPALPVEDEIVVDDDDDDDDDDDKNVTINVTVESYYRQKKYKTLVRKLKETKNASRKRKILLELKKLHKECINNNNRHNFLLAKKISNIIKETSMSRRTRRPSTRQTNNAWWLFEGEELEDEGMEMEDEAAEDKEAEESVSKEEIVGALAPLLGIDEEELQAVVSGDEAGEDEDLEDEEEELELEADFFEADYGKKEADYGEADMKEDMDEADMKEEEKEKKEADKKKKDDEMVEINESALRRELMRMRRRKKATANRARRRMMESRRRRRLFEAEAQAADPALRAGGEVIEVDEETLINALAEELGDAHEQQLNQEDAEGGAPEMASHFGGGSAESLAERRRLRRRRISENRVARANKRAQLAERKARAAKKELLESNLFNAKLLYVNKLMQQHDLNTKQQRAIVEALDNAKTLREAKLLYTSLTDSLRKRRTNSGTGKLTESRVLSGRSSTSTKSSNPAKTNVELNRWAKLAGINKK
jgi:hypothetical protein